MADAPPSAPVGAAEETISKEALQGLIEIGEQLRSNRVILEQTAWEARDAAARNEAALSNGLNTLEGVISAQQEAASARTAREFEALQSSNRVLLTVSGALAAMAALAMLLLAFFQWRMSKSWAGLSTGLSVTHLSANDSAALLLASGGPTPALPGSVQQSNGRLLGAVEQLERRIEGLEQTLMPSQNLPGTTHSAAENGDPRKAGNGNSAAGDPPTFAPSAQAGIQTLLAQGQSMLRQNELEGAIRCFDELLALTPNHSEALVKKGAALERLQKLNEAFECYDLAIAADPSTTTAYLHKGGLCNRLERFKEALECFEKALQTHEEWRR